MRTTDAGEAPANGAASDLIDARIASLGDWRGGQPDPTRPNR